MKTLSCHDVSGQDDDFIAKGETDEDVIKQLSEHGQTAHPEMLKEWSEKMTPEEMTALMKEKIKEE